MCSHVGRSGFAVIDTGDSNVTGIALEFHSDNNRFVGNEWLDNSCGTGNVEYVDASSGNCGN